MGMYLTPSQMAEEFGMDRSTVHKRIKGIRNEIEHGRYGVYAISGTRTNKAVFLDYEKYRTILESPQRDNVPEFNIREAISYMGG